MFRSIFLCQKSMLVLCSCFFVSQFLPCQNSLSQKTATLYFLKVKSGFPKTDLSFFLYRKPFFHNSFPNKVSILEPLLLTACIFFLRCSLLKLAIYILYLINIMIIFAQ